jgi:hypothetical protein
MHEEIVILCFDKNSSYGSYIQGKDFFIEV